jgi:hypothetical protein
MASETTVDVWSDIHCPWALIAVHRLRTARAKHCLDVVFAPRAWPLEWINGRGTPRDIVTTETAVLASHEPALFNGYTAESWPSTFLPAFELVAAARRVHGIRVAEDVLTAPFATAVRSSRPNAIPANTKGIHVTAGYPPVNSSCRTPSPSIATSGNRPESPRYPAGSASTGWQTLSTRDLR